MSYKQHCLVLQNTQVSTSHGRIKVSKVDIRVSTKVQTTINVNVKLGI